MSTNELRSSQEIRNELAEYEAWADMYGAETPLIAYERMGELIKELVESDRNSK